MKMRHRIQAEAKAWRKVGPMWSRAHGYTDFQKAEGPGF